MRKLVAIYIAFGAISACSIATKVAKPVEPARPAVTPDPPPPVGGPCEFNHYKGAFEVTKLTMVRQPTQYEAAIRDVTYQFFVDDQVKQQYEADLKLAARKFSRDPSTYIKQVSNFYSHTVRFYGDDVPKVGASSAAEMDVEVGGWHCAPVIAHSVDANEHLSSP